MAKIKGTQNLPKWIKSKGYDELLFLSHTELLEQVSVRKRFYKFMVGAIHRVGNSNIGVNGEYKLTGTEEWHCNVLLNFFDYCQGVKKNCFIYNMKPDSSFDFLYPETEQGLISEHDKLIFSKHIKGITVFDMIEDLSFLEKNKDVDFSDGLDNSSISVRADYGDITMLNKNDGIDSDGVNVNIDLRYSTDKEILHELGKLLELWRNQLDIKERSAIKYPSKHEIRNVIKYRTIQIIDLMIWELISGNKIAIPTFDRAIFDDDSDVDFEQVAYKLAKKFISNKYKLLS